MQLGDEERAAHVVQSPDEERSRGEPVDERQAAHEVHSAHDSHSSG